MSSISIGDLAQTYVTRRQNAQLKATVNRLAQELASGKTADVGKRLSGDFTLISGIETSLKTLASYRKAADEAAHFSGTMQLALGSVQDRLTEAASGLILIGNPSSRPQIQSTAADVRQKFDAVISALNTQVGERSIFAGVATDGPALASGDAILADLQVAIAGLTTVADVEAAIDTWFSAPGGGFETSGYTGSTTALTPFQIAAGQAADLPLTAADPALRDVLKGLATAALVAEGVLAGDLNAQAELLRNAGDGLLTVGGPVTEIRAGIGTVEAHIDTVLTQNATETAAFEIARSDILSVDPYGAATELEAAQTQLETLYALTARMSRLALVDFLR